MTEWLTALLASPLVIAAIAGIITVVSKSLDRRSQSWARELNAKAALLDAEAQLTLAEAKARESQTKLTESEAHRMRTHAERQDQQIEALFARVAFLEEVNAIKDADLRATRAERDEAHEQRDQARERIDAMLDEYARIRRAGGRLPKDTPKPFARFDTTTPVGTQGKNA